MSASCFNRTPPTLIYALSLQRRSSDLAEGHRRQRIPGWRLHELGLAVNEPRDAAKRGRRKAVQATALCSVTRSEEHTSELQSLDYLLCRLLLEKKNKFYGFACHNKLII